MRVLLTTTPFSAKQSYYLKFPQFPVLNLTLLASFVEKTHDVKIVSNMDCIQKGHRLYEEIKNFRPEVLGVSIPSAVGGEAVFHYFPELIRDNPDIRFIAGGQYASSACEVLLNKGFNSVVTGPAEGVFSDLINAYADGGGLDNILGIAYKDSQGKIRKNSLAPYRNYLNEIPFPSRKLLPLNRSIYGFGPAASMEASRGCPFSCRFCTVHDFLGKYHEKSNSRILEELEELAGQGIKEILFVDNSFGVNAEKTELLAREIIQAKFGFVFGVYFRADTISSAPENIGKLGKAGLKYAIVGFESYAQNELDWMNKKTTPLINEAASEILRKNSIAVIGSHIVFCPVRGGLKNACNTYREGMKNSDLFKAGAFTVLPDAPFEREKKNDKDRVRHFDCLHVREDNVYKKILYQTAFVLLSGYSFFYPGQWRKIFSKNKWISRIVRREFKVYFWRLILLFRPFQK